MAEGGGEGWSGGPKHGISHLARVSYFSELSKIVKFSGLLDIAVTPSRGPMFYKKKW